MQLFFGWINIKHNFDDYKGKNEFYGKLLQNVLIRAQHQIP